MKHGRQWPAGYPSGQKVPESVFLLPGCPCFRRSTPAGKRPKHTQAFRKSGRPADGRSPPVPHPICPPSATHVPSAPAPKETRHPALAAENRNSRPPELHTVGENLHPAYSAPFHRKACSNCNKSPATGQQELPHAAPSPSKHPKIPDTCRQTPCDRLASAELTGNLRPYHIPPPTAGPDEGTTEPSHSYKPCIPGRCCPVRKNSFGKKPDAPAPGVSVPGCAVRVYPHIGYAPPSPHR